MTFPLLGKSYFFACAAIAAQSREARCKNSRSAERGCSSVHPPPNRRRMGGGSNLAPPPTGYAAQSREARCKNSRSAERCARRRVSERNRRTAAALSAEIDTRPTFLPEKGLFRQTEAGEHFCSPAFYGLRRPGNHTLCGRFQCRYPDRSQRRPQKRRRRLGLPWPRRARSRRRRLRGGHPG